MRILGAHWRGPTALIVGSIIAAAILLALLFPRPVVAITDPLAATPTIDSTAADAVKQALVAKALSDGAVRVIVGLDAPFRPEEQLAGIQLAQSQRAGIAQAQDTLLQRLSSYNVTSVKKYRYIP